ncbi:MAG TPA: cystatin domain-containing protein [Pyrinomonadaceae bacterium]|jgi:hypothetical protein
MNQKLRFAIILSALGIVFGCASATFAQTDEPIAGGYSKASVTDKEVVAAAGYAVKAQAKKQRAVIKLVSINKAETQVVAGRNYSLCLKVRITEKGKKTKTETVQAIVFQNLKQKLSLTSWKEAECGKEM